jgi:hypothetical protein
MAAACGSGSLWHASLACSLPQGLSDLKTKQNQNPDEPTRRSVLLVFSSLACATESVASYRKLGVMLRAYQDVLQPLAHGDAGRRVGLPLNAAVPWR